MNSKDSHDIPSDHPRYESLKLRAKVVDAYKSGILADSGLIAHGRGEAFDYLLGEETSKVAKKAIEVAAATLLLAENPVISVNGNTAALVPGGVVELAGTLGAKIEINIFYHTPERIEAIEKVLKNAGAREVMGSEEDPEHIKGLESPRSRATREGVYKADVVLVPLEDGDRAEALVSNGKKVVTVDLNPLSRTAKTATVTIVDNLVRAIPYLTREVERLKGIDTAKLQDIVDKFDNQQNLQDSLKLMLSHIPHKFDNK
jgi:4-phosphopantoate--beta-alanine ligase